MASMAVLRLIADEDWLRLVAYRGVLREIARIGALQPWERGDDAADPAEMAEAVLSMFGDSEEVGE